MIYRSQEPLRVISDLNEDTFISIMRVPKKYSEYVKERFNEWPRLEKPMENGDSCYLYIQSGFYKIHCQETRKEVKQ